MFNNLDNNSLVINNKALPENKESLRNILIKTNKKLNESINSISHNSSILSKKEISINDQKRIQAKHDLIQQKKNETINSLLNTKISKTKQFAVINNPKKNIENNNDKIHKNYYSGINTKTNPIVKPLDNILKKPELSISENIFPNRQFQTEKQKSSKTQLRNVVFTERNKFPKEQIQDRKSSSKSPLRINLTNYKYGSNLKRSKSFISKPPTNNLYQYKTDSFKNIPQNISRVKSHTLGNNKSHLFPTLIRKSDTSLAHPIKSFENISKNNNQIITTKKIKNCNPSIQSNNYSSNSIASNAMRVSITVPHDKFETEEFIQTNEIQRNSLIMNERDLDYNQISDSNQVTNLKKILSPDHINNNNNTQFRKLLKEKQDSKQVKTQEIIVKNKKESIKSSNYFSKINEFNKKRFSNQNITLQSHKISSNNQSQNSNTASPHINYIKTNPTNSNTNNNIKEYSSKPNPKIFNKRIIIRSSGEKEFFTTQNKSTQQNKKNMNIYEMNNKITSQKMITTTLNKKNDSLNSYMRIAPEDEEVKNESNSISTNYFKKKDQTIKGTNNTSQYATNISSSTRQKSYDSTAPKFVNFDFDSFDNKNISSSNSNHQQLSNSTPFKHNPSHLGTKQESNKIALKKNGKLFIS